MLLELSRLGSMHNVAELLETTTSTVSQQIAALARETGTALIERDGRRVRLTPAGRRLADHAAVKVVVHEHEPAEALALLATDEVDLALTYDYNLAPATPEPTLHAVELWSTPWTLGVPASEARGVRGDSLAVFDAFRESDWIGNSRNRADEDVVRIIASMAGFQARFTHQSDNLDVVEDLIASGMGVGLLPADRPTPSGVAKLPLTQPDVRLRAYARTRRGRAEWPPLRLLLERLSQQQAAQHRRTRESGERAG